MSDKPFERGGLDQATLRAEVEALRREVKRLERLESALESIANDGCGLARQVKDESGTGWMSLWCPDLYPDDREQWCWCCIARAALKEHGDE